MERFLLRRRSYRTSAATAAVTGCQVELQLLRSKQVQRRSTSETGQRVGAATAALAAATARSSSALGGSDVAEAGVATPKLPRPPFRVRRERRRPGSPPFAQPLRLPTSAPFREAVEATPESRLSLALEYLKLVEELRAPSPMHRPSSRVDRAATMWTTYDFHPPECWMPLPRSPLPRLGLGGCFAHKRITCFVVGCCFRETTALFFIQASLASRCLVSRLSLDTGRTSFGLFRSGRCRRAPASFSLSLYLYLSLYMYTNTYIYICVYIYIYIYVYE